jgi:small-conductance mechanosensitive channel
MLHLKIQNSDDVIVSVPNSQLTGVRVYNLSRTPHSQVKQTLRISYDDASKIPLLLDTIKEEIRQDCGDKLLPDRLRAHWSNFEDDHLQVEVDAHFEIKPSGGEYHDNRQKVLQAIYRAAEKTGVHFVVRVGN